jgi:hypothetical protein
MWLSGFGNVLQHLVTSSSLPAPLRAARPQGGVGEIDPQVDHFHPGLAGHQTTIPPPEISQKPMPASNVGVYNYLWGRIKLMLTLFASIRSRCSLRP